eukprot:TRINITY_DN1577_c1_g1_i4.p1 TRINITY_DN1577_c1_g1~~TRINITY_DN1577_c1_g1_i4.p1  ORF type:complete len:160 (-),score=21.79 TRINITY_DN1577_c1_g1_i4:79-558(-)
MLKLTLREVAILFHAYGLIPAIIYSIILIISGDIGWYRDAVGCWIPESHQAITNLILLSHVSLNLILFLIFSLKLGSTKEGRKILLINFRLILYIVYGSSLLTYIMLIGFTRNFYRAEFKQNYINRIICQLTIEDDCDYDAKLAFPYYIVISSAIFWWS